MYEALRVLGPCLLEGALVLGNYRVGSVVMDVDRYEHRDPPVAVLIIVPSEEGPSKPGSHGEPAFVARHEVAVHSIGLGPRAADLPGDEYRHGGVLGPGQLGRASHDDAPGSGVLGQVEDQVPP